MISIEEAVQIVRESVALICNTPIKALTPQTRPQDVRGWDSFGRLQVALEIEHRLGRSLSLREAVAAGAIHELAAMVSDHAQ